MFSIRGLTVPSFILVDCMFCTLPCDLTACQVSTCSSSKSAGSLVHRCEKILLLQTVSDAHLNKIHCFRPQRTNVISDLYNVWCTKTSLTSVFQQLHTRKLTHGSVQDLVQPCFKVVLINSSVFLKVFKRFYFKFGCFFTLSVQ